VGKSITFDSGGLSLKPGQSMEKMKYDMAGGAAVLGALAAVAELKLPLDVVGVLPATENLPAGRPSMPGDVVTALTGKTIEILNTDAEGRLVLADALGYAVKHLGPREVIDVATLTGACSSALGEEAAALFSNDDALCARVEAASAATGERVWRMPLFEEYGEYLKSQIADLQNTSNTRSGGLVTAGYFLGEFVGDTPWAHLDIAGTAWRERDHPYIPKGARGMGVRLLVRYLRDSCGA
jgi:leucyl aminopeptidase